MAESVGIAMPLRSKRILHTDEGFIAQCDCTVGDSFPARENESEAREDLVAHITYWTGDYPDAVEQVREVVLV